MGYKTEDLKQQALAAIKKYNLIFIEDVVSYLPCSKPTFYEHKLNESNEIKEAITDNKVRTKSNLRKRWYESDNPTLQLAVYRLMSTPEEHARLNNAAAVVLETGSDDDIKRPTIIVSAPRLGDGIEDATEVE